MILLFNKDGDHVFTCQHIPDSHKTEEYTPAELLDTEPYDFNRIYTLVDGEIIVGDLKPVDEELVAALEAELAATEYQRRRAVAYPKIEDQLDTLFHGGYEAWQAQIQSVKDAYPKPE
jgi:hypothetical protein